MRVVIANSISAAVHIAVIGGLAVWTVESWELEYRVASGHVITVRYSPESSESQEKSVTLEAVQEPPPPEVDRVEWKPQPVVVELAEVLVSIELPPVELLKEPDHKEVEKNEEPPPKEEPTPEPPKPEPPTEKPPTEKPMTETPQVNAAAAEFEALAIAGAITPDTLPSKLPLNPAPQYPVELLNARIEGRLVLRVLVNTEGTVDSVTVFTSSGYQSFDDSALNTVRNWRFAPARKGGRPMPLVIHVPVGFYIPRR